MAIEMVVPMENLADPIPIDFTFKCTNTDDATIYVKCELVSPPAGWNGAAQQMGSLGIGIDDYFLCDAYTRDRPANLTEETIDFKISYYSDVGYANLITSETLEYEITFVDFNDVGFNVVDDDTFEVDLEGWTKVDEVGSTGLDRYTFKSRTGVASMRSTGWWAGEICYATKSFTIGAVTRAFIRVWFYVDMPAGYETMFEVITDAGGVSQTRTLKIAMDGTPIGGTEICEQWICVGLKMPVNGTFEVRLRNSVEVCPATKNLYFDDIRVVES